MRRMGNNRKVSRREISGRVEMSIPWSGDGYRDLYVFKVHQAFPLRFLYFTACKRYLNLKYLKYIFCLGEILDVDAFWFQNLFYL